MIKRTSTTPLLQGQVAITCALLLTILGAVFAVSDAQAQSDAIISYGDTVTGEVTSRAGEEWSFSGCADDIVTVEMDSDDFDAYVELYGPTDRLLLTEDDNSAGEDNALIEEFKLQESGVYSIIAAGATRGDRGKYTLSLESDVEAELTEAPSLAYGDNVEGEVRRSSGEEWTFWGCTDDVVTLLMETNDFIGYLEVYEPDVRRPLAELAGEDDGLAIEIDKLILPVSGLYTVIAAGDSRRDRGEYSLSLSVHAADGEDEVALAQTSKSTRTSTPTDKVTPTRKARTPTRVSLPTPTPTNTRTPRPTKTPTLRPTETPTPRPTNTATPQVAAVNAGPLPAPVALQYDFPAFKWRWEGMPAMTNVDNWYFDIKIFDNQYSEYPYDVKIAEVVNVAADGPNQWRYDKQSDFQCGSYWAIQIAQRNPDGSYAGPMGPESNRVPTNQGCDGHVDPCPDCD